MSNTFTKIIPLFTRIRLRYNFRNYYIKKTFFPILKIIFFLNLDHFNVYSLSKILILISPPVSLFQALTVHQKFVNTFYRKSEWMPWTYFLKFMPYPQKIFTSLPESVTKYFFNNVHWALLAWDRVDHKATANNGKNTLKNGKKRNISIFIDIVLRKPCSLVRLLKHVDVTDSWNFCFLMGPSPTLSHPYTSRLTPLAPPPPMHLHLPFPPRT